MRRFTYHQKAEPLKSHVLMLRVLVSVDGVVLPLIGLFLPRPWNWVMYGLTAVLLLFSHRLVSRPLRGRHLVGEQAITLVAGHSLVKIDRNLIIGAERYEQSLPRSLKPVTTRYVPEEDTLYILPDKKNLVRLTLRVPVATKAPQQGEVEFTKVVFVVDEPQVFLGAIGAVTDGVEDVSIKSTAQPLAPTFHASQVDGALELQQLTKRFGNFTAVAPLSFSVAPGEVLAFLGSNGAGKSTTIKMIVGLLRPSGGQVLVNGQSLWDGDTSLRRHIGYVPDTPMLYENLTAREHFWLVGGLYDLPEAEVRQRSDELLTRLGLARHGDQLVRSFSLGMKRKLAIASALLHQPSILLLDEATNGLDPRAAREVKDFIADAARSGTAVLLTTHLLDVVSELAHRVAVIDGGSLQAVGSIPELQRAVGNPDASLEELFLNLTTARLQGVSA